MTLEKRIEALEHDNRKGELREWYLDDGSLVEGCPDGTRSFARSDGSYRVNYLFVDSDANAIKTPTEGINIQLSTAEWRL